MDPATLQKDHEPCVRRRRTSTLPEPPPASGLRDPSGCPAHGPPADPAQDTRESRGSAHEHSPLSPAVGNPGRCCQTAWPGGPVGIVQFRKTREQFLRIPTVVRPPLGSLPRSGGRFGPLGVVVLTTPWSIRPLPQTVKPRASGRPARPPARKRGDLGKPPRSGRCRTGPGGDFDAIRATASTDTSCRKPLPAIPLNRFR